MTTKAGEVAKVAQQVPKGGRMVRTVLVAAAAMLFAVGSNGETCAQYAKGIGVPRDPDTGLIVYQQVVQTDGLTAAQLYARAKLALVTVYRSAKDVTQLEDKENGRIVAKGTYAITGAGVLGTGPQDRVRHTLTIECKDGRYRVTLSSLEVEVAAFHNEFANFPAHTFPFEVYAYEEHSCFGRKTMIQNAHRGALELLKAVQVEMAKSGPAGTDKW